MIVKHMKKRDRSARIIAEFDNMVLFDALEKGKVFYPNMVRPSGPFWEVYSA